MPNRQAVQMPLPRVELDESASRSSAVYEALKGAIVDGSLAPGERLVERDIAAHYAISRTPVREALRKLESDEMVLSEGRGVAVASYTLQRIADISEVRATLEGMAARLAARSTTSLELRKLEDIAIDYRRALDNNAGESTAAFGALTRDFHNTIALAGRNAFLAKQIVDLRELIGRLQASTLHDPERRRRVCEEHDAILHAIRAHDADTAEHLMREHLRSALSLRLTRTGALTSEHPS